eukprot:1678146-Amphidinium_carterae.1
MDAMVCDKPGGHDVKRGVLSLYQRCTVLSSCCACFLAVTSWELASTFALDCRFGRMAWHAQQCDSEKSLCVFCDYGNQS